MEFDSIYFDILSVNNFDKYDLVIARDFLIHIDNNDTIEDIVSSHPWQKFMRELTEKPEESSYICFEMCCTPGNRHRKQEKW